MIIDLKKFIAEERPYWTELDQMIEQWEKDPGRRMDFSQIRRFHYLYQRASADLAKIMTFSSERKIRLYLESLVGRTYAAINETRGKPHRLAPIHWFFTTFPTTFRKYIRAFWLALAMMLAGAVFGGFAISVDPEAKEVLLPFDHLKIHPSERVAKEEADGAADRLKGAKTSFSSFLMTHNTRVSIFVLALGMTWGVGTVIVLFSNGVMIGAIALDYIFAGETVFLVGWLLPHGAIEIPAILLAGQAGLVLAGAVIGKGERSTLAVRLRDISGDLVTLIFGVAAMLVWAGVVEAFFSQYHEPVLPYELKIAFGVTELFLLILFLSKSGAKKTKTGRPGPPPRSMPATGTSL
ncbi:MAG: stage II sporulation protein M [Desulfobacterales bacterium]|nr:stage II sporulation protein M [Desulfobacterales bacterium]